MRSCPSSSHCLEADDSQPSSCPAVSSATEENDVESPFIEKITTSSKSTWFSDITDLFVLLASFLSITASIVLFALVLHSASVSASDPPWHLSFLQRAVATVSVSITTAVMMVIGKRYVLFKLAREGLRSRRVAIYSNPSIGNLASHLVLHGMELPLLGLSAVWGLALVTSLTVNDTWEYGPSSRWMHPRILAGPLNPGNASASHILAAATQFAKVPLPPQCLWEDSISDSSFKVINASISTDYPTGVMYHYPALNWAGDSINFSYSTTMNSFNISTEQLYSIPPNAHNLPCTISQDLPDLELWLAGTDNQTLTILIVDSSENGSIFRFDATVLIVGGILSSTGNHTEFVLNGTSWPNVMNGNQWAEDVTSLICNATCPSGCGQNCSLFGFAEGLNLYPYYNETSDSPWFYPIVNSALNMALGAYSSVVLPIAFNGAIQVTIYHSVFTIRYGIYILAANIIISVIMLTIALKLRLASPLGSDFINSTRLLLDPLKKPELFNASLDRTVEALADPYMLVRDNSVFLLAEEKSAKHRRGWRSFFGPLHDPKELEPSIQSEDQSYHT